MTVELLAHAKINLFLDITGRLENGYHLIRSIMQSISLADRIRVTRCDCGIHLTCRGSDLPCDERNLAYRTAEHFLRAAGINGGAEIEVEKHIPVSAGLAGGSTDAAAVLRAMNVLYGSPFSMEELTALGKKIGADVPFCLSGGTMEVSGIGEILTPLSDLPDMAIVVAKCGEGVSTPQAYGALDRRYANFAGIRREGTAAVGMYEALCEGIRGRNVTKITHCLYNVFEDVVLLEHEDASALKRFFLEKGATALMSGSGPSVFGVFPSTDMADDVVQELKQMRQDVSAFSVVPVSSAVCGKMRIL